MHVAKHTHEQANYYLERLCPRADDVFRMAYLVLLNKDIARACVLETFRDLSLEVGHLPEDEAVSTLLFKFCWKTCKDINSSNKLDKNKIAVVLGHLGNRRRAALVAIDVLGVNAHSAAEILGIEDEEFHSDLAVARKALVHNFA